MQLNLPLLQSAEPPSVEALAVELTWLLLGAALVGMLARHLRVPYAVALVLGGLAVEASHLAAVPRLEPGVVLFVFLPPLLFDAAFRFRTGELPRVLRSILLLAVPGTVITALVVGGALSRWLGQPLAISLLFGSIVAATDPVAVVAVFRRLGVSHRLEAIAEGESMINDGIAITLYTALMALALGNPMSLGDTAFFFLREVGGGVLVGAVLGVAFSRLTALVDDHLIEMTLSTALAYGSYLAAQALEGSGPLACVAAGLIHGTYGRSVGMSETTSRLLDDLWEYLGFLANGVVFLLVGLSVSLTSLAASLWPVTAAVVAVTAARGIAIFGLAALVPGRELTTSIRERALLVWGGLRGALTAALALALPAETPARDLLITMAFGVVLFTLVAQGLTLPLAIRGLGIRQRPAPHGAPGPRS